MSAEDRYARVEADQGEDASVWLVIGERRVKEFAPGNRHVAMMMAEWLCEWLAAGFLAAPGVEGSDQAAVPADLLGEITRAFAWTGARRHAWRRYEPGRVHNEETPRERADRDAAFLLGAMETEAMRRLVEERSWRLALIEQARESLLAAGMAGEAVLRTMEPETAGPVLAAVLATLAGDWAVDGPARRAPEKRHLEVARQQFAGERADEEMPF